MARKLTSREKRIVSLAALILGLIALAEGVVFPTLERHRRLQRQIFEKNRDLQALRQLKAEYQKLRVAGKKQLVQARNRKGRFTLFSYLDELAGVADVKKSIIYMKPSTIRSPSQGPDLERVEMKIQGTTMDQLVRFIHGIESGDDLIRISRLSISRTGKAKDGLTAVFQVETPTTLDASKADSPSSGARG